jgi:hypothetical protein
VRGRILNLVGIALIVGSLCSIALLLHETDGGRDVQVRSWLPTAAAHR